MWRVSNATRTPDRRVADRRVTDLYREQAMLLLIEVARHSSESITSIVRQATAHREHKNSVTDKQLITDLVKYSERRTK